MEALESLHYKGYSIDIFPDECDESPRVWDNLSTLVCWHKRMNIGDKNFNLDVEKQVHAFNEVINEAKKNGDLMYPLYIYDHSGVSLSVHRTYPYNDPWDAGQVGIVIVSKKDIREAYNVKKVTKQIKEKVFSVVENEIKTYNQYLNGEVYGYVTYDSNGEVDSCWGFYDKDECIDEAKGMIDHLVKEKVKRHCNKVKQWIKHKVPLLKRHSLKIAI